jgi:hypothetical protein
VRVERGGVRQGWRRLEGPSEDLRTLRSERRKNREEGKREDGKIDGRTKKCKNGRKRRCRKIRRWKVGT